MICFLRFPENTATIPNIFSFFKDYLREIHASHIMETVFCLDRSEVCRITVLIANNEFERGSRCSVCGTVWHYRR